MEVFKCPVTVSDNGSGVMSGAAVDLEIFSKIGLWRFQGGTGIGKKREEGAVELKLSEMCKVLGFRHKLLYMYQMHLYKAVSRDS